ncbi:MAG: hypothetical protein WKF83_06875 [Nocardioidaceae bacterium]
MPCRRRSDWRAYFPCEDNRTSLCNDLDEETTAWFLQRQFVRGLGHLLDPSRDRYLHARECRCTTSRLLKDRTISEAARQQGIDLTLGVHVHDLDSGHLPMLSQPTALANLDKTAACKHDR